MVRVPLPCQAGFSLLELVIVIILVVLLFLAAFTRLLPLRGDAEAAHVATVTGSLRSAIGLEAAYRVTRDGLASLAELEGVNPMVLLQEHPEGYIGEIRATGPDAVQPGSWYFDLERSQLVYQVRFPEYLDGSPQAPVSLRWQVRLQYEDVDRTGRFDPERDRVRGLRLEALHGYRWTGQPGARIEPARHGATPVTGNGDHR